jgi:hypothetical protein
VLIAAIETPVDWRQTVNNPSGISPRKERATFERAAFARVSALLMVEKRAVVAVGIELSRRRASKPNMRWEAVPRIIEAHDQITVTKSLQRQENRYAGHCMRKAYKQTRTSS